MTLSWAHNVLTGCLRLQPDETVLVMVDEPLRTAGGALCAAAREMGAFRTTLRVIDPGSRRLAVVPATLLSEVAKTDVLISLLSQLDLGREVAPLRAAVAAFRLSGQGRWAYGAGVDAEMLAREFAADSSEVARSVAEIAARLQGADRVHLQTSAGTDLHLRLGGRPIQQETGILDRPGAFGNLPAGEVFAAPLEASAEGRLVVDLSLGDLELDEPVTLTFRDGRVTEATGGLALRRLQGRLGSDPWAWTIGELGIGANPSARVRGRVIVDEKALGTAHIALGGNRSFGGENPAETHYDCVFNSPRITLDGRPF